MGGFAKRFLTSFDGTKTYGTSLSSHKTGTCERTSIGETSPAMMHVPFVPFLTALTTSLTPRFRAFTFAAFFTACASVLREENAMNGSVLSWSRVGVRESPRGWAVEPHCPSRPSRPGGQGRGQQEPAWRARTLRIFFESFSSAIGLAMADSSLTVPMLAIELYPLPSLSLSLSSSLSLARTTAAPTHSSSAAPRILPEKPEISIWWDFGFRAMARLRLGIRCLGREGA